MKPSLTPALLLVSGFTLSVIGAAVLLLPHAFFATSGITLGDDASLMSEIRAPGGLLLASGVVVVLGAFRPAMRRQALIVAAIVYGSFGASRLLAIGIDGVPSEPLLGAMGVEFLLAISCACSLYFDPRVIPGPTAQARSNLPRTIREQP